MSDSKKPSNDLTNLSIPGIAAPEAEADSNAFFTTPDSGGVSHLEGLDDLLAPIAPGLSETSAEEMIENLPPMDPEIQRLAQGITTPIAETPVGATIAAKLSTPMEELRDYSENLAPAAGPAVASTPYSVLIEGTLKVHEREALMQILVRENLGIREVELEPQFQAGRILIPRVSEYIGVVIVQALRNADVRMRLGPSDKIYGTQSTDGDDPLIFHPANDTEILSTEEGGHPADLIPLSADAEIKGLSVLEALDTLHSSMNLKAIQLAQPQSPIFQDAMETLKRQLKFQAHHRGANGLLSFKYELHPLEGKTVYKLVVQAQAVRFS